MKSQDSTALPRFSEAFVSYGAIELKRCYQKHLGLAVAIAGALHLLVIGGFLLYGRMTAAVPEAVGVVRIKTIAELPQVAVAAPGIAPPSIGIPEAVPDEEAPEEVTIATQEELGQIADLSAQSIIGGEGGGDSIAIEIPLEDYLPSAEDFVPYDEQPVPLNLEEVMKGQYPPLAKEAGIEGVVWVQALVDKKGTVRDAKIFKASGSSAGFEEIALKAAYKVKFKPAISNNQPVAVWAVYPVRFTLK
jgi:protein TonB